MAWGDRGVRQAVHYIVRLLIIVFFPRKKLVKSQFDIKNGTTQP